MKSIPETECKSDTRRKDDEEMSKRMSKKFNELRIVGNGDYPPTIMIDGKPLQGVKRYVVEPVLSEDEGLMVASWVDLTVTLACMWEVPNSDSED